MNTPTWFEAWFNSPHYHLLYKGRDESEARGFIKRLTSKLGLPIGARVLDLACGKGRHSVSLAELGFDVLGVDIAPDNITQARQLERSNLRFAIHDMRQVMKEPPFDAVLNLFTSFGYFENAAEHQTAIHTMASAVKSNGVLVIDYLNVAQVSRHLISDEQLQVESVQFLIKRREDDTHFLKEIQVNDPSQPVPHFYRERVAKFSLEDFTDMLAKENMKVRDVYGDYDLHVYDPSSSPRLVLIATRN